MALALSALGACADDSANGLAAPGVASTSPTLPAGADATSAHPVGQEWRQQVAWGAPSEFYRDGFRLYQSAIEVCMEVRGFDYEPSPWYDDDLLSVAVNPLNRVAAARYGYHLPPYGATNDNMQRDESPEFQVAMNGNGDGVSLGCGDVAFSYAYGGALESLADDFDFIVNDVSTTISGFDATSEATRLLRDWSACMEEQGYDYQSPDDPLTEFGNNAEIGEDELRVRLADLECDTDVGLTAARSSYEGERFEAWLDRNAEIVREYESSLSAAKLEVTSRRDRKSVV